MKTIKVRFKTESMSKLDLQDTIKKMLKAIRSAGIPIKDINGDTGHGIITSTFTVDNHYFEIKAYE
jgi:hypothetical protein